MEFLFLCCHFADAKLKENYNEEVLFIDDGEINIQGYVNKLQKGAWRRTLGKRLKGYLGTCVSWYITMLFNVYFFWYHIGTLQRYHKTTGLVVGVSLIPWCLLFGLAWYIMWSGVGLFFVHKPLGITFGLIGLIATLTMLLY